MAHIVLDPTHHTVETIWMWTLRAGLFNSSQYYAKLCNTQCTHFSAQQDARDVALYDQLFNDQLRQAAFIYVARS